MTSPTTCSWVAKSYLTLRWNTLLLKSRLATLKKWGNFRPVNDTFTDLSPVPYSPLHILTTVKIQWAWSPDLLSIVSHPSAVCGLWLVSCVKRRRGRRWTDREGGKRWGRWAMIQPIDNSDEDDVLHLCSRLWWEFKGRRWSACGEILYPLDLGRDLLFPHNAINCVDYLILSKCDEKNKGIWKW